MTNIDRLWFSFRGTDALTARGSSPRGKRSQSLFELTDVVMPCSSVRRRCLNSAISLRVSRRFVSILKDLRVITSTTRVTVLTTASSALLLVTKDRTSNTFLLGGKSKVPVEEKENHCECSRLDTCADERVVASGNHLDERIEDRQRKHKKDQSREADYLKLGFPARLGSRGTFREMLVEDLVLRFPVSRVRCG